MIQIYDDIFTEAFKAELYFLAVSAKYTIGWDDTSIIENRQYPCLHYNLSKDRWEQLDLINRIGDHELRNQLNELSYASATINLAVPSSIQFQHTHDEYKSFLYYINLDWKNEYYGETLFYDKLGKEIIKASRFKPGRGIYFDGKTPHTIRPSAHSAPQYRFTLFAGFNKKNFIEEAKNSS